jgi:hypothetical protein
MRTDPLPWEPRRMPPDVRALAKAAERDERRLAVLEALDELDRDRIWLGSMAVLGLVLGAAAALLFGL